MPSMTIILIAGGVFAVLLLIVGVTISVRDERSFVDERLGQYVEEELFDSEIEDTDRPSPITNWLDNRLEGSKWADRVGRNLAQADIKLRSAEYLALMVIAAIGLGALAWYLGGRNIISGIIGGLFGLIIPRIYIARQKNQRLNRFDEQLQDMLNLVVNGLRAGFSTVQAMEAVSKELPAPISKEFRRVVQEMQIGIPMDEALDNLHRRIPSDDLDLIIVAINVQREVGGNLAEILDTISFTIRERVRIKGEIRVLTSQAMYSGRFLALLPIILALILWFINRDYMMTMFTNMVCGIIWVSCIVIMISIGYFVMTRIADIEV
jgi:tight adherence protein B